MKDQAELLVSSFDAEALAAVLGETRGRADGDAATALVDLLQEATLVPGERFPAEHVAMRSRVTYEELATGMHRTVVLVHPADSDPSAGRVSVLSPIGRALLGRRSGTVVAAGGPAGRSLAIRILSVAPAAEESVDVP